MTELQLRHYIVSIMQGWVGIKEGSADHKKIIDLYNTYRPLPRGYQVSYKDAWCAACVSAAAIAAQLTDICFVECSCSKLLELYAKNGRWIENDAYVPSPGDLILYDWDDNGIGDNKGVPDHVGMVETVIGNTITVIEGNYNDMVKRRTMQVNGKYIRGYCCPDYASKAKASLTPTQQTVQNGSNDGVISDQDYWVSVIDGKAQVNPANIKILIDKYHAALQKAKGVV